MQHYPFFLLYDSPSATQAGQKTAGVQVCETCHASFTSRYAYSGGIGWYVSSSLARFVHCQMALPINPVLRRDLWKIRVKMVWVWRCDIFCRMVVRCKLVCCRVRLWFIQKYFLLAVDRLWWKNPIALRSCHCHVLSIVLTCKRLLWYWQCVPETPRRKIKDSNLVSNW